MSDCNTTTSGLPFEDPFNIPENCVVDFSNISFSNDFCENVNTAFIYLRNIDFSGKIDFSKLSFEQKENVLKLYINRDLKDLSIPQLDYAIFKIFLPDLKEENEENFFSKEEKQGFTMGNMRLLEEMFEFIISIPLFVMSLDRSGTIDTNMDHVEHTSEIPQSYECILNLLKYKYSDILCIENQMHNNVKPRFYDKLFYYENGTLADIVKNSMFSRIYRNILSLSVKNAK